MVSLGAHTIWWRHYPTNIGIARGHAIGCTTLVVVSHGGGGRVGSKSGSRWLGQIKFTSHNERDQTQFRKLITTSFKKKLRCHHSEIKKKHRRWTSKWSDWGGEGIFLTLSSLPSFFSCRVIVDGDRGLWIVVVVVQCSWARILWLSFLRTRKKFNFQP